VNGVLETRVQVDRADPMVLVLHDWAGIVDDPTKQEEKRQPLIGGYSVVNHFAVAKCPSPDSDRNRPPLSKGNYGKIGLGSLTLRIWTYAEVRNEQS
jgi:hypothetical protein